MDSKSATLGAYFREMRLDAMLSQRELAKKMGTFASVICRIETGKSCNPNWRTMNRYATACDKKLVLRSEPKEKPW